MKFIRKRPLSTLIFLGIVLRLFLLFPDYAFDVNNHIVWAKDLFNHGFDNFFYTQSSEVYGTRFPNYPPLSLFIFYIIYPLGLLIYKFFWFLNVNVHVFPSNLMFFVEQKKFLAGLFKIPSILADLGIVWLIYLFAKKIAPKNKKLHLLSLSLFLFNPIVFYNSAFWGQIDAIPIFFVLWSIYILMYSKRYLTSAVLFTVSLLVKPTILIFLPIYLIFFINKFGWLNFLKSFLVSNALFLLFFIPFLSNQMSALSGYKIYFEKILLTQSLPYTTNSAYNFWAITTKIQQIKDSSSFLFNISYQFWGLLFTGLFFLFIIYLFLKKEGKISSPYNSLFLSSFVSFLFLTKMHERYIILILPFLLISSIKNRKLIFWFVAISIIGFLNMYQSWPVPKLEIVLSMLNNYYIYGFLSLLNILIFLYLLFRFKKSNID